MQSQSQPRRRQQRPCRPHQVGTAAVQAPVLEGAIFPGFILLCPCLPIIFLVGGVCWTTEICLPHCFLCSLGLCSLTQESPSPPPYFLSPWGHVVWEQQPSSLCPIDKGLSVGRAPSFCVLLLFVLLLLFVILVNCCF